MATPPLHLPPAWEYAVYVSEREHDIRLDIRGKAKTLFKFGSNATVGTATAMLWSTNDQDTEAAVSGNAIDKISSTDAGDVGQTIYIEGHTISGTDLTFTTQTATLNGTNKVTLSTPLHTVTRVRNDSATAVAGNVYVYEDTATGTPTAGKPDDTTKIHGGITPGGTIGAQQSEKAATAISSVDYYFITSLEAHMVGNNTTARAQAWIEEKKSGGLWLPKGPSFGFGGAANSNGLHTYDIPIEIDPNSQVRMMAWGSTDIEIAGGFHGFLASIVG